MPEQEYRLSIEIKGNRVLMVNADRSRTAEGDICASDAFPRRMIDMLQKWIQRSDVFRSEREFEVFGHCLFEILFPNADTRDLLEAALVQAKRRDQIVRIELEFSDNNELAKLPWEYLWYPKTGRFISRHSIMVLTRYIRTQAEHPDFQTDKLNIAVLQASMDDPEGEPPLARIQGYADALRKRLTDLEQQTIRLIAPPTNLTFGDFQTALDKTASKIPLPNILHIVAPGRSDGRDGEIGLARAANDATPNWINAETFGNICARGESHLKLIILQINETPGSSRFADVLDRFVKTLMGRADVPAVIAMQQALNNPIMVDFMDAFYREFLKTLNLGLAVQTARDSVAMRQYEYANEQKAMYAFGAPVLYMRTNSGQIMRLAGESHPEGGERDKSDSGVARTAPSTAPANVPSPASSPMAAGGMEGRKELFQAARKMVREGLALSVIDQSLYITRLRTLETELNTLPDAESRRERFAAFLLTLDGELDDKPSLAPLIAHLDAGKDGL